MEGVGDKHEAAAAPHWLRAGYEAKGRDVRQVALARFGGRSEVESLKYFQIHYECRVLIARGQEIHAVMFLYASMNISI